MAQSFPDDTFDVAVMPLVIFFVPNPEKGVAETVRVVCPGGLRLGPVWRWISLRGIAG
jgi:ubiquinone/menaquinone biosynthesis C-methylase UbiE